MEEALRALLVGAGAVTALVPAASIVWSRRVGLPAVVLWKVAGGDDYTHAGPASLNDTVVQIDCWGATALEAKTLARAVKAALTGVRASTIDRVFILDERDSAERGEGAITANRPSDFYRSSLDVRVWNHDAAS